MPFKSLLFWWPQRWIQDFLPFPWERCLCSTHDLNKQTQSGKWWCWKKDIFLRVVLKLFFNTDAVHPADVSRHPGEDGGLLVSVAAAGRHKAGHTVDNPLTIDTAVQGATRIALHIDKTKKRSKSKNSASQQIALFFRSTFLVPHF